MYSNLTDSEWDLVPNIIFDHDDHDRTILSVMLFLVYLHLEKYFWKKLDNSKVYLLRSKAHEIYSLSSTR